MSDEHVGYIGEVHEELANNPQCSVCGAVMVAGDPWKCLSCEGTVPAVSDEQVKGIPGIWVIKYEDADVSDDVFVGETAEEDARKTFEIRNYNWNCHLFGPAERIARSEQALAALQDPDRVHASILTGSIKLTKAQAIHIAGLPADIEQALAALEARNRELEASLNAAILTIDGYYQGVCCCDYRHACGFCKEADRFMETAHAALKGAS